MFNTLDEAVDQYKIIPPLKGEKIYVEDQGAYFTYDGEQWIVSE